MTININSKCILGQMPFHDCSHHTKKLCIVKNMSLQKIYSSDVIAISLERIRKGNRERERERGTERKGNNISYKGASFCINNVGGA